MSIYEPQMQAVVSQFCLKNVFFTFTIATARSPRKFNSGPFLATTHYTQSLIRPPIMRVQCLLTASSLEREELCPAVMVCCARASPALQPHATAPTLSLCQSMCGGLSLAPGSGLGRPSLVPGPSFSMQFCFAREICSTAAMLIFTSIEEGEEEARATAATSQD